VCILYKGVKSLLRCDGGRVVAGIVTFVLSQRGSLRFIAAVLRRARATPVADAIMLVNGMRCFVGVHPANASCHAVAVAHRPNERRAIEELKRLDAGQRWGSFEFSWHLGSVVAAIPDLLRTAPRWWQIARISRILNRRHDAFHASRVVELLFYYQRYCQLFARQDVRMAAMSSHSNPHGIALNVAARKFGIPVVLITHGMPITPIARLDYDLAIMECDASADVYRQAGCAMRHVVVKSRKRDFVRMSPPACPGGLTIGIFLSKDPAPDCFVSYVRRLLDDARVDRILVRPHPVNLWRGLRHTLTSLADDRLALADAGSVFDDVRRCDVVLAGNSTVHVDALLAGKPSCYVRGLDHAPFDVQSFVKDGLVFSLDDPSQLDPAVILRFYQRPEWLSTLRRYANVDQDEADVARTVSAAVRDLALRRAA
jgi:hypothetical protein